MTQHKISNTSKIYRLEICVDRPQYGETGAQEKTGALEKTGAQEKTAVLPSLSSRLARPTLA